MIALVLALFAFGFTAPAATEPQQLPAAQTKHGLDKVPAHKQIVFEDTTRKVCIQGNVVGECGK